MGYSNEIEWIALVVMLSAGVGLASRMGLAHPRVGRQRFR